MARGIKGFTGSDGDPDLMRIGILVDRKTGVAQFEDEETVIREEILVYGALCNIISWMQASRNTEAMKDFWEQLWKTEQGNGGS